VRVLSRRTGIDVKEIISSANPEELEFPIPSVDHADHVVYTALKGHVRLAADHLLHKEMIGKLENVIRNIIRKLDIVFHTSILSLGEGVEEKTNILNCARIYELMLEMALNFSGLESKKIIGFSEEELEKAVELIRRALNDWENFERSILGRAEIAKAVVEGMLAEMKKVMSKFYRPPGSMLSYMAKEIEKRLKEDSIMESFLTAAIDQLKNNIYYKIGEVGLCLFGNDYALGLRWMRHLGFVQVSTNPVLAAIAFEDDPSLWEGYKVESFCDDFKKVVEKHPYWFKDPEKYGDEIAAYGTEVSIWPNLAVFRPIAIASNMFYGMISLQLNPNIADDYEASVRDAFRFYRDAEDFLKKYDSYLLWGYSEIIERGRPNIVFKVSGSSPASNRITTELESHGIGTNNTVVFTVSQEVWSTIAKMEGRAKAVKRGIPLTTVYVTNMGGRLDDHIREHVAEKLLMRALGRFEDKEGKIRELAEKLGALEAVEKCESLEEKVRVVCSRKYLRPMNKDPFIDLLTEAGIGGSSREEVAKYLSDLEYYIGMGGICVTKRVYQIFFTPENREKWIKYLQKEYGLTREQAEEVMRGIHVLPASKRKPIETLDTLASKNMVNTEFPNQQMKVLMESLKESFDVEKFRETALIPPDQKIVKSLLEREETRDEFRKAWELTPKLIEILKRAGIKNAEDYGDRGLRPEEWGEFGATVKTMNEFIRGYNEFKKKCIEFVKRIAKERGKY